MLNIYVVACVSIMLGALRRLIC